MTGKYWMDVEKLCKAHEKDGLVLGFYVIDKKRNVAEIQGDPLLKQLLHDAGSKINKKWKLNEGNPPTTATDDPSEKEGIKPAGATVWLPYLPEKGIEGMTDRQLKMYWSVVMRTVLPKRQRNLGYDTTK